MVRITSKGSETESRWDLNRYLYSKKQKERCFYRGFAKQLLFTIKRYFLMKGNHMKKTLKMILTTCLLLLAVCGASLSVSARTYYYQGLISIDPSFSDSVFDANEEIQIPLTVKRFLSNNTKRFLIQILL